MPRKTLLSAIILIILVVGAVLVAKTVLKPNQAGENNTTAMGQATESAMATPQEMASTSAISPQPTTASTSNIKSFTVTGSNFAFSPSTLTVSKGDTVKITFVNSGGIHDFVIDEFNAKTSKIQSGQSETIQFVADKAGKFSYYCSVANHRAMGMEGTLTVQ